MAKKQPRCILPLVVGLAFSTADFKKPLIKNNSQRVQNWIAQDPSSHHSQPERTIPPALAGGPRPSPGLSGRSRKSESCGDRASGQPCAVVQQ